MKTLTIMLTGLGLATVALPTAAQAAPWQTINQRQARLDARIDQGVRAGTLTRVEAGRVRADFRALAGREASYRRTGGLSAWERTDLDHRFDALSARIYVNKHDRQTR